MNPLRPRSQRAVESFRQGRAPNLALHRGVRGFTLIEVLLAVMVFAIVLAAMHTVFYGAIHLRNKTTAALEKALPLQHALAIIKRDLAGIVYPGGSLAGELATSPTQWSVAGGVRPEFYTATGHLEEIAPWAEVQRVTYYLVDPTNRTLGKDLIRVVTRNLLPTLEEEPVGQWLMGGVEDMSFYFFDGVQWLEEWDSTVEETQLPQAVKVQIRLAQEPEEERALVPRMPIEFIVPIVVQSRTNQVAQQTTDGGQL
jgi:general secretion pathway protein J